jgi:Oxidoreductase molybdopterin binding domain
MYHEAYVKDLPLERVPSDVLIAYELNGAPLPAEHGFPARLVVPGFYSTNSVKWRDPRVGLSIIAMENPYEEAQLRGGVIEQRPDWDFAVIDRVSHKYTGKPFPFRDKPAERLVLVIAVKRARYFVLPFVHAPASR